MSWTSDGPSFSFTSVPRVRIVEGPQRVHARLNA